MNQVTKTPQMPMPARPRAPTPVPDAPPSKEMHPAVRDHMERISSMAEALDSANERIHELETLCADARRELGKLQFELSAVTHQRDGFQRIAVEAHASLDAIHRAQSMSLDIIDDVIRRSSAAGRNEAAPERADLDALEEGIAKIAARYKPADAEPGA